MSKRILITGLSSFIGKNVTRLLLKKKYDISAIVYPKTHPSVLSEFENHVTFYKIDLADILSLKDFLKNNKFDTIIHIGAILNKIGKNENEIFRANVFATEQLIINAMENDSSFIFSSTTGVFGSIPRELPANNETTKTGDNYYHKTKIRAEALLEKYVLYGLKGVIVRPSIIYGQDNYGFPYQLVRMVDKQLYFLSDEPIKIHLTNVDVLTQAFVRLTDFDFAPGQAYIVADKEPVYLLDLVKFIHQRLHNKELKTKQLNSDYFSFGEKLLAILGFERRSQYVNLLSNSWFYETKNVYSDLSLKVTKTIPEFKTVVDFYMQKKRK